MTKSEFIAVLAHPEEISLSQTNQLEAVLESHPFFQAAHAMRLKGLKEHKGFLYNSALKKTAAYTTDRGVLFDWITSEGFLQHEVSKEIKKQKQEGEPENIQEKLNQALREESLSGKKPSELEPSKEVPEALEIGKPLDFDQKEAHSFSEWLQLTKINPISRTEEEEKPSNPGEKERKAELIDKFISKNPKIVPSENPKKEGISIRSDYVPEKLMTQTLARVYLEQKNYKKAIQAYKILILKNPEKSGFFADQIRAIEKLQENKIQ